MIAQARERCAAHANVTLRVSSGRDLAGLADESLDLILAADVFPYLVQVGPDLVASHVREAARVLRPGGSLVIFNMSYRDDPARDLAELTDLAHATNLALVRTGVQPFRLWDATAFQLAKPPR
jgi:ubiquinone/menaquinone biosynthesis C-methylase UbiE